MTQQKNYTSKDVRVLEEVEHIRLNPGMYIGETSTPVHLLEEALDNALDEALAGHATIIAVLIDTKNNIYSVLDNGRGIPIEDDTPITISSKLFSGAKFQDEKSAYQISSGLHGVGLVAVNALSDNYQLEIYRNNQYACYKFEKTKLIYKKIKPHVGDIPFSTKIEFKPGKKYFDNLVPDVERLRMRLTTASAEMNKNIHFVLAIDGKQQNIHRDTITHFAKECITMKDKIVISNLTSEKIPEKFNVIFTYEQGGPATPKIISSVNLLPVKLGGSHVNVLYDVLKEFFQKQAKKHNFSFQPTDCLYRLRAYLMLALKEPKFSGQTKDSLINVKSYFDRFAKDFKTQLDTLAQEDENLIKEYMQRFQDYRVKLDSKKLVSTGSNGKRASTQFTKLRDCTSRQGELYIVEGDSAGGSIIQSRDPRIHAILPLKGKSIPNITTKKNILQNKEVGELVKAIGAGVDTHFNINKMRYDKIVCATDADHDGNHIACLVTMVIAILMPDILKSGRYFIAQTPLFAINEGKTFIPLWNEEQLEKAKTDKRRITRFKGLGELSPPQLKMCLLEPTTRNLMPIKYSENIDSLIKLFSSAEEKRKLVGE
jgi:DNA gyrase subunit B